MPPSTINLLTRIVAAKASVTKCKNDDLQSKIYNINAKIHRQVHESLMSRFSTGKI
jgi:hypothetical protein